MKSQIQDVGHKVLRNEEYFLGKTAFGRNIRSEKQVISTQVPTFSITSLVSFQPITSFVPH